ncbi:MAG TPA: YidC/Oxa1 family insertase periplasmic-domain containing protein, partial [Xylella taiwanensis]
MNQTRVFLIFSWLVVATLLWMEWGKNKNAALEFSASHNLAVHSNVEHKIPQINAAASIVPLQQNSQLIASGPTVTAINVTTDVLQLKIDGFSVLSADLLRFPQSKDRLAQPVKLLTDNPAYPYTATSGW